MAKLIVDTGKETGSLGDLYGIFFEDLNHAADGGLYAELLQNRAFEYCNIDNSEYHAMTAWEEVRTRGSRMSTSIQCGHPLNNRNPHYLVLEVFETGEHSRGGRSA